MASIFEIRRSPPAKVQLPALSAAQVFNVVSSRLTLAGRFTLTQRLAALLLAAAVRQVSDGRWIVRLPVSELARVMGASERSAQSARAVLVARGVFRSVSMPADVGGLVLELPRERSTGGSS